MLIALGLLVGIAAGVSLAAVAGARRTTTAYERFRERTHGIDAVVFGTQVNVANVPYDKVLALPEAVDGGRFALAPIAMERDPANLTLAPADAHLYRSTAAPLVRRGRLPNPDRDDEVFITPEFAKRYHVGVGDELTLISATDINAFWGLAPLEGGPTVVATIVGEGESEMQQMFGPSEPWFLPSSGFLAQHPEVPSATNLVVRLRPGTDVDEFAADVARVTGIPGIPVRDAQLDAKRYTHSTELEKTGLLIFAAAVALAGLVLVGQALTRTIYGMADDVPTLRALGFSRREVAAGLLTPITITAVVGVLAAPLIAVALSPRFPVGLSRRLEPDPGAHVDWPVLLAGALLVGLLVYAGSLFAVRRSLAGERLGVERASRVARWLRESWTLPASIGAGFTLDRGRGRRALPSRPALAGVTVGVIGVVASAGLLVGIQDATAHPARSGQVWDGVVAIDSDETQTPIEHAVLDDHDVDEVALIGKIDTTVNGVGLPLYAMDDLRGHMAFTTLHGRPPANQDEVAIGPSTAKQLGVDVGDEIDLGEGKDVRSVRIVGVALLPQTPHYSFDQGLAGTRPVLNALMAKAPDTAEGVVAFTTKPGVSAETVVDRLHDEGGYEADVSDPPQDVLLLGNVRALPKGLAVFIALLGLAALAHVLVAAVRHRRNDLAVMRAMGLRPRQAGAAIAWQAMTVGVVGLVLGVPIGIAAGHLAWRWLADRTPLLYVSPLATDVVLLLIPTLVVVALVLAAMPARQASRLPVAEVLRTE